MHFLGRSFLTWVGRVTGNDNIFLLGREFSVTGLIQHTIIRKQGSRDFQRYMTCLYRASIGMSYTVGKLMNSAILTLFHPARY